MFAKIYIKGAYEYYRYVVNTFRWFYSLPNVTILNGSEVTPSERDKNETFFLQHYKSSSNRPARFGELIERHGKKMSPLINMRPLNTLNQITTNL